MAVFDEPTPLELIRLIQPDVLVKGEDYSGREVVGREVRGGRRRAGRARAAAGRLLHDGHRGQDPRREVMRELMARAARTAAADTLRAVPASGHASSLCSACAAGLEPVGELHCLRCGRRRETAFASPDCGECFGDSLGVERARSLYIYNAAGRALLAEFKYRQPSGRDWC